jgi:hypothetical protein
LISPFGQHPALNNTRGKSGVGREPTCEARLTVEVEDEDAAVLWIEFGALGVHGRASSGGAGARFICDHSVFGEDTFVLAMVRRRNYIGLELS